MLLVAPHSSPPYAARPADGCDRSSAATDYPNPIQLKGGELSDEQPAFNRALGAIRVRIEDCIGWAKNWAILAIRLRYDHTVPKPIPRTICGLVNVQTARWQAAKAIVHKRSG